MADQESPDDPSLRAVSTPEVPVFYANTISVAATLHDMRLTFGKVLPGSDLTYDVAIYLPYTAAKQLASMLNNVIAEHEKIFGEIRLEPIKKNGQ